MQLFEQNVYNYILNQHLVEPGERIVVGVSGGADSVCLLCVFKELMRPLQIPDDGIAVVHVHHGIRGKEADQDACFTRKLSEKLGFPYYEYQKDIPSYAQESGMSVEEAGREYRYRCMEELAEKLQFDKIAVAHNREDVAETVLFHIIRGSGLRGLAGIPASRGIIIRPLLGMARAEIESYLAVRGQSYCKDSTNQELLYSRNKIRHLILPVMKEINDRAVEHICQVAEDAERSYDYIHEQAITQYDALETEDYFGKTITLKIEDLYKIGPVLQEHVVGEAICQIANQKKDITRKHIQSVVALIYQDTGAMVKLPYGICARRNYGELIVTDKIGTGEDYNISVCGSGEYDIPKVGKLFVEIGKFLQGEDVPKKNYTKYIDYDKIKDTLCIRTPENGDYIVIDRENHTKKLSRVFIDAKIDRMKRAHWPVLACGKEVLWVIGLRFSPAYYVKQDTKHVMRIEYQGKGDCYGTKD